MMIAVITSQMFHGYGVMVFPLQRLDVCIFIYIHIYICVLFQVVSVGYRFSRVFNDMCNTAT